MVRGHRNDIDGLRAVAILPVLFYHANVWPFASGYVGVDIFFVISGYLITGLILREQDGSGFSLAGFYDRRIRRILPALGVVLLAASVAALFVLLPSELRLFGKSLASAVLFVANIVYWLRGAAYFAPDAAQNPLLHVWSLSVEEQFYLFWPLILIGLARYRRALPWIIAVLAAASLAMALLYARADPIVAFYLLPTRAWQLLCGALLATGRLASPRNAVSRNAIALSGLGLVLAAATLSGGPALYHPLNALGAALGTTAILFAADGGANAVSAMLATRVPVFIGRISYSLYLWHWPALVFARLALDRALSTGEALAVLAVAFVLSTLSWKFIEQPVRRRRDPSQSIPIAAAASAAMLVLAGVFVLAHGLPGRLAPDIRAIDAEGTAPLAGRWCGVADDCVTGDPAFTGEAVLWGDSHARALAPGLEGFAAARRLRLRQYTQGACPPLPDIDIDRRASPAAAARCKAFNRAVLDAILRARNVRLIVLEARWEIILSDNRLHGADPAVQLARAIDGVLAELAATGVPVLIVGNVPAFPYAPAICYGHKRLFGRDPAPCMVLSNAAAVAEVGPTDAMIGDSARRHARVRAFFPAAALCDPAGCHAFSAGHVLYADDHHLSLAGAQRVGRALETMLRGWPQG